MHVFDQAGEQNLLWLERLAVRLICVLALDRFGDYISDEVSCCISEYKISSARRKLSLKNFVVRSHNSAKIWRKG